MEFAFHVSLTNMAVPVFTVRRMLTELDWIDFGCSYINSEASWRFPIAFQIVFALTILMFILELPESPRYIKFSTLVPSHES